MCTELRDEHREVSAPIHCRWARRFPVGLGQRANPVRVGAGELEHGRTRLLASGQHGPLFSQSMTHTAPSAVGKNVVGPQVAVTGLKYLRRLDPGL
jgi:hypothetical protein